MILELETKSSTIGPKGRMSAELSNARGRLLVTVAMRQDEKIGGAGCADRVACSMASFTYRAKVPTWIAKATKRVKVKVVQTGRHEGTNLEDDAIATNIHGFVSVLDREGNHSVSPVVVALGGSGRHR